MLTFKVPSKLRLTVFAVSILMACVTYIIVAGLTGNFMSNDALFLAVVVLLVPIAFIEHANESWKNAVDRAIPRFVSSISGAQDVGMSLPRAMEESTKLDYGPLTAEIKKFVAQVGWRLPFEEGLARLAKRIGTLTARRFSVLIGEASRSGGDIRLALKTTADFMAELFEIEEERKKQMKAYIIIIYMGFFIFLFTIAIMASSFFIPMTGLQTTMPGVLKIEISLPELIRLLFHMMVIQAILGGLVAGKMGEGKIFLGLKHSLIMLVLGYVGFKMFIPGV
ncbi:MAG: type II secretion system F family protein [Candidatus Bathyarchaeota archaeon]|nr:type II secretion system F family protein [Candidatus Bathyarchaeota archaeon]